MYLLAHAGHHHETTEQSLLHIITRDIYTFMAVLLLGIAVLTTVTLVIKRRQDAVVKVEDKQHRDT